MLKLKFNNADEFDKAFGIDEERHKEFAILCAKLTQKCLGGNYGKSDAVVEINKFAKNDNEIAYGILLFGMGISRIESSLEQLVKKMEG